MKLVFLLIASAVTVSGFGLDQMFHVSCGGVMGAFVDNPEVAMQMDAPVLGHLLKAFNDGIKERAMQSCTFTDDQLELFFPMRFDSVLRALDPAQKSAFTSGWPANCPKDLFSFHMGFIQESVQMNFPGSCSYDKFMQGQGCQLKWNLPETKMSFEISVRKCPIGPLPSFTMVCSGSGCQKFGKPCETDNDCSGGVGKCFDTNATFTDPDADNFFHEIFLMNNVTDKAACTSSDGKSFAQQFFSGLLNEGLKMLNYQAVKGNKDFTGLKMCGIQEFIDTFSDESCTQDNVTMLVSCTRMQSGNPGLTSAPKQLPSSPYLTKTATAQPLFWADCQGNMQLLHEDAIGSLRGSLPMIQKGTAMLTRLMKDLLPCRGTVLSDAQIRRFFSIWSLDFFPGVLATTVTDDNLLNNFNPAAQLDNDTRIGNISECVWNYTSGVQTCPPPPFPNIQNYPSTCTYNRIVNDGACDFQLSMDRLFAGFPTGKDTASVRFVLRTCAESGFPSGLVDCQGGACDYLTDPIKFTTAADGNCGPSAPCDTGYKCIDDLPPLTDWLIDTDWARNQMPPVTSYDVNTSYALGNFLRAMKGRSPLPWGSTHALCLFDFDALETNAEDWGDHMFVDDPTTGVALGSNWQPYTLSTADIPTGGTPANPIPQGSDPTTTPAIPDPQKVPLDIGGAGSPQVSLASAMLALLALVFARV